MKKQRGIRRKARKCNEKEEDTANRFGSLVTKYKT